MNMKKQRKDVVRCAIYTRVSTDEQAREDCTSLESQREICEHYISVHKMDGWVSSRHFEDPGFSGKDMDRPAVQALMSEIEAGNVDVVLFYKMDRLSRSLCHFYDFWSRVKKHNVAVVSATQPFDSSNPTGKLMMNMLLTFAQFERELIGERTTLGMKKRAEKGKWHGGPVPLGYEFDKKDRVLKIHAEESKIVKEIYQLAKKLRNATQIANALNNAGKRTKKRVLMGREGKERVVGGKRFRPDKLRDTIANSLYKGVIKHGEEEYKAEHPAIVSVKLWQEANAALAPTKKREWTQQRDKHVHLLKGLLKCEECGRALSPYPAGKKDKDGNPYLYYACTSMTKEGSASKCPVRSIPARMFEALVIGYVAEIGKHPEVIKETITVSNQQKKKSLRPLKKKLAELDKEYVKAAEAVQNCIELAKHKGVKNLSRDFIKEGEKLSEQKRKIEVERERVKVGINYREQVVADEEIIANALLEFGSVFGNLPPEDQKELIKLIVREVTVNHFDPNRDEVPNKKGCFKARIRTKWYLLNISLYANKLIPTAFTDGVKSSDSIPHGTPKGSQIRTLSSHRGC